MTDFRALCTELVEAWDSYSYVDAGDAADRMAEAVKAARAALAAAPEGEPSDQELYDYWIATSPELGCADPVGFARAVLARWGRPTPAPAGEHQVAPVPVPVSERLPEPNTKVLAHYFNDLGKGRTICAIWVPAKTRSDSYGDGDFTEYDEETDNFYWPEGWYEAIENWEDLGWVKVDEGEVVYWQPLPKWPALAAARPALPPNYIDPEYQGEDLELLQTFYAACRAEGGTADEIHLRGLRAVLAARRPAPATPTSDSIGRLCDALARAVRPDSGYRALTSDDLKSGEEITGGAGEQIVGVEWWLPQLGCDSLQQTLDSIKGRIIFAVRDWWKTTFVTTTLVDFPAETIKPPAEGEVAELMAALRADAKCIEAGRHDLCSNTADQLTRAAALLEQLSSGWVVPTVEQLAPVPVSERLPGPEDCITNPRNGQGQWCWGWVQHDPIPYSGRWRMIRRDWLADEAVAWLPAHALPLPAVEVQP